MKVTDHHRKGVPVFIFGLVVGWLTAAPITVLALALADAAARADADAERYRDQ